MGFQSLGIKSPDLANTSLEWICVENEQTWLSISSTAGAEASRQQKPTAKVARLENQLLILALLVFLGVTSSWHWKKHNLAERMPGELEVSLLMQHSHEADAANDTTLPFPATTQSVPGIKVEEYERFGDRVEAQVTVTYPVQGRLLAYRETHFLQKTANGWLRTEPVAELRGPLQTLETTHFTIRYRAADAAAVHHAAEKLEQFYVKMRLDFGLPVGTAATRYTIKIGSGETGPYESVSEQTPDKQLNNDYGNNVSPNSVSVPSPALLSVPVEMTADTVLYQSLVNSVAQLVVAEAMAQGAGDGNNSLRWYRVANALHLWAVWNAGGPLAQTRTEIVQWLYVGGKDDGWEPAHLCRIYGIWQQSSRRLHIPLDCSEQAQETPPSSDSPAESAWNQERFDLDTVTLKDAFESSAAIETVIAYGVTAYGRETLPVLIAALGQHTSVNILIPEVYGLSSAEFETGWKQYLAEVMGQY